LYSSSTSNAITPVAVGPKTSRSTNQEEEEMKGEEEEEETAGNDQAEEGSFKTKQM